MLTIVTTSRNDDHGHNLTGRTQRHIDNLAEQADTFSIPIEYILVEWNPPDDHPPITDAVDMHPETPFWHPRVITVPPDLHYTFQNSGKIPLYQMIAKNVGIRRATGEFILCTNIDIIIPDDLFAFITSPLLSPSAIYRTDRIDVGPDVPAAGKDAIQEYCRSHILRRNTPTSIDDYSLTPFWRYLHRARNAFKHRVGWYIYQIPKCYTLASGDFQLLHRDEWMNLRGYPEMPVFSIHIDSLFQIQAHYSGMREVILPYPTYHIEHAIGTSLVPGGESTMYKNLVKNGVPFIPYVYFLDANAEMKTGPYRNGKYSKDGDYWHWKDNTPDGWGLAGYNLPEVRG